MITSSPLAAIRLAADLASPGSFHLSPGRCYIWGMKHTLIATAIAALLTSTSVAAEAYNIYTAADLNEACTILIEEPYDKMETWEVVSASHTCGRPIPVSV